VTVRSHVKEGRCRCPHRRRVGVVGSDSVADFTALGEAVNVTARLASLAGAGEVLISEAPHTASGSDLRAFDRRELALKGRDAPLAVRVLRT
jgi:adenylate cyclase